MHPYALIPWQLDRLVAEMDHLLDQAGPAVGTQPVPSLWADDDAVQVTLPVPGLTQDQIQVQITGSTLTITAERPAPESANLRQERSGFRTVRALQLPVAVDADQAKAQLAHGILVLHLPRAAAAKRRTIAVSAN
jgi:HSP20 family protein